MALPGWTPTLPEMTDGPVFVTVVPASTAKDLAVPSPTGLTAPRAAEEKERTATVATTAAEPPANIGRML
jgi:hypothetical protein